MAFYRIDVADMGAWEQQANAKSIYVIRRALGTFAEEVLPPSAPVDTGFMVSSSQPSLGVGRMAHPVERPDDYWDPEAAYTKLGEVKAVLRTMRLGDTFNWAWPAIYTRFVDQGIGQPAQHFLSYPIARWDAILRATKRAMKRA